MDITPTLSWVRVSWVRGRPPPGMPHAKDYEVREPPCNGEQSALVLEGADGKRSTILDPFTLDSYLVTNQAAELQMAKPRLEFNKAKTVKRILDAWDCSQRNGLGKDLDTAAVFLRALGAEVPTVVVSSTGPQSTEPRGGKPAADSLLKPVKRNSKRGKVLAWFLEEDEGRSVRAAMADFGDTRSSILSTLHVLNKDHGIGYSLSGDAATIDVPGEGSPFAEET